MENHHLFDLQDIQADCNSPAAKSTEENFQAARAAIKRKSDAEYLKRIAYIRKKVAELDHSLHTLVSVKCRGTYQELAEYSVEAAYQGERLCYSLRSMVFHFTAADKKQYLHNAQIPAGVSLRREPNHVTVVYPEMIPGRSKKESLRFITELVWNLLEEENQKEHLPRFERCMMAMVRYYDPRRRGGDFDNCNFEQKRVQDMMCTYMLIDDSCKYVDWYCTGVAAESDWRTEYHFMAPELFDSWRKTLKKEEKQGVKIAE